MEEGSELDDHCSFNKRERKYEIIEQNSKIKIQNKKKKKKTEKILSDWFHKPLDLLVLCLFNLVCKND